MQQKLQQINHNNTIKNDSKKATTPPPRFFIFFLFLFLPSCFFVAPKIVTHTHNPPPPSFPFPFPAAPHPPPVSVLFVSLFFYYSSALSNHPPPPHTSTPAIVSGVFSSFHRATFCEGTAFYSGGKEGGKRVRERERRGCEREGERERALPTHTVLFLSLFLSRHTKRTHASCWEVSRKYAI